MAKNKGNDLPVGVESFQPVNVIELEKPKYKGIEFLSGDAKGQSLYFKVNAAVMEPIDFFVALEEAVMKSPFHFSQLQDLSCRCKAKLIPEMLTTFAGTGVQVDMDFGPDAKDDVVHILKLR